MADPCYDRSLTEADWQASRSAYQSRVRPWVDAVLRRRHRGTKHPVHDFLFEYYAFRPAYLLRWSPGVGVRLEGATAATVDWPARAIEVPGGAVYAAQSIPQPRRDYVQWVIRYLEATGEREPAYGCFGLHEWAMVYQERQVRHSQVPLRLSPTDTDLVVEQGTLRCTHFDAYRFFTPPAVPRNRTILTRATTTEHDQPGCLHVNMDLYKWAFTMAPYISSERIADAFEVAMDAREIDMRASPYHLEAYGYPAIPIETRVGREEYVEQQRRISERARPVRQALLEEYRRLARWLERS